MRFLVRGGFVRCPSFEKQTGVLWAVTTRALGDMKDSTAFAGALRRLRLPQAWAGGEQVHGRRVRWAVRPSALRGGFPSTDGVATARRGLTLRVFAADCAPVLITDGRFLALVHAGWRGAAGGVLESALALLRRKGARVGGLSVLIGPCIQDCCYEVGPEVARVFPSAARPRPRARGKFLLDLPAAITARAARCGVPPARIFAASHCTACDRRFHSFRRDKTEKRLAALAARLGRLTT